MITDHVYRSFTLQRPAACPEGGCAYMSCRRPKEEHKRAVSGKSGGHKSYGVHPVLTEEQDQ